MGSHRKRTTAIRDRKAKSNPKNLKKGQARREQNAARLRELARDA